MEGNARALGRFAFFPGTARSGTRFALPQINGCLTWTDDPRPGQKGGREEATLPGRRLEGQNRAGFLCFLALCIRTSPLSFLAEHHVGRQRLVPRAEASGNPDRSAPAVRQCG